MFKLYKYHYNKLNFEGTTARSVWTSGSSDGDSCDIERSFIWCSTGSKINDSVLKNANFWANSEIPGYKPMPQKCLALKFPSAVGNVGLAQSDCGELNSLLCLVNKHFTIVQHNRKTTF